jgi:hypothetical protein
MSGCGSSSPPQCPVAHKAGLKAGILLFDVRGFFNNINHGHMMAVLENLGYPPELV